MTHSVRSYMTVAILFASPLGSTFARTASDGLP